MEKGVVTIETPQEGVLRGSTVLLVEDTDDNREAFARLLVLEGARVLEASTAAEAIGLAAEHAFDILMSDLGLPDIPGDVLIRKILADAKQRPRVVVITGYGEPHTSRAKRAGADLVLTKPVPWTRLVAFLAAAPAAPEPAPPAPPSAIAA
jgi:two-component system, chemotaxis family, CheB/CheR fusion protein